MSVGGVYLAYPIDQRRSGSLDYLFQQIDQLKSLLVGKGTASWVFDPGDAFRVDPLAEPDGGLPAINRAALNWSDVVVAFLPAGVASIGVPIEIDRARSQGKHVFIVSDIRKAWMLEMPNVYRVTDWQDQHIQGIAQMIAQLEPPVMSKQYQDLPFQMLGSTGQVPKRAYDDDAGLDLMVSEPVTIEPGEFMDVPTQVAVQLPPHTWGLIVGRSSAFRKKSLLVLPGVIDAGYRGELFSAVFNTSKQAVKLKQGDRVAQLIVLNNGTRYLTPVEYPQLDPSPRGDRGFGSSGS